MSQYLVEVSWEVCNKVGGIYTVIRSKAGEAVKAFDDNYLTIGPLLYDHPEFEEASDPVLDKLVKVLAKKNIPAKAGRWNIEAKPKCLLIDFSKAVAEQDKLFFHLWEKYGVDSVFGSWDYIEPVLFSTACGMVVEELSYLVEKDTEMIGHFHEWMTGAGILYLKENCPAVSTVFTTHATILGRAMSGSGVDIYSQLDEIDAQQEAKRHNILAKYSMESTCAREADAFAAVSDITGIEATALLGVKPHVITPNGFNIDDIPDLAADPKAHLESREKLLGFAGHFLNRKYSDEKTKIISISGRYEYHNKGLDILIEALSRINKELRESSRDIKLLTYFLVIGGNVGVHDETKVRMQSSMAHHDKFSGISTHHLGEPQHDPILNGCRQYNLTNDPGDPCSVIFIPVILDGNDGVINMEYYDVLSGCDLGVYPSNYEPWGYTPLESAAFSVPALTSDKAGFGKWVVDAFPGGHAGVEVIDRFGKSDADATDALTAALERFIDWDDDENQTQREGARQISSRACWADFYKHYREAYESARASRDIRLTAEQEEPQETLAYPGSNSVQPRFRPFSVTTALPENVARLKELANNLWWSWNPPASELFSRLEPTTWETIANNPTAMLERVGRERIEAMTGNDSYAAAYQSILATFDAHMAEEEPLVPLEAISSEKPVAYFSMEFGVHESIPTYSGGLGVLSGDHMKSASDLNLPIVGVSLMYSCGYFRQRINRQGEQIAEFDKSDFSLMPIEIVKDRHGKRIIISVEYPGRTVFFQVWQARIGRARILFIDTDLDKNSTKDRTITDKLYDGATRERVEQEILLGIGGVRMLAALDISPAVFHMNEGHSAFLLIERIKQHMSDGYDFETARELVKGSSVFTTHTPVPAGNERFDKSLIEHFFKQYVTNMGIAWDQFWNLGHVYAGEDSPFDMTLQALKLSCRRNGVSKLHGVVSREMWQKAWNGITVEEVPISSITNGVHVQSWLAEDIRKLIETFTGISSWDECLLKPDIWDTIDSIPDSTLWRAHISLKSKLITMAKGAISDNWTREGEDPALLEKVRNILNPTALTIGFARRFATYKRPTLLMRDVERIKKIISNAKHPVQFIFAGKAHPADKAGSNIINHIVNLSKQEEFIGKIIFLENYNIRMARALVAGVDVWLNNPVRPMEASGTSGMKAAINGVPNCSILDGWWDECYNQRNGWAIGSHRVYENPETQAMVDSESLYDILENHIVPAFYKRDNSDMPVEWVAMMKESIKTVIPIFNTHRMVADYIADMYEPAAQRSIALLKDNAQTASQLAEWKRKLPTRFGSVHIQNIQISGIEGDEMQLGEALDLTVHIDVGTMDPKHLLVEAVIQMTNPQGTTEELVYENLKPAGDDKGIYTFTGSYKAEQTGTYRYGVRVFPIHDGLVNKFETGLVVWG